MMKDGKEGLPLYLWYAADVVLSDNSAVDQSKNRNLKYCGKVRKNKQ